VKKSIVNTPFFNPLHLYNLLLITAFITQQISKWFFP